MVLVRFGWIHTKFCSFALVVWHRLQQRKLILAKNETHKKQKHNQNTESPKTTRQDSPEKTQQNQTKQKPQKQSWQVLIILCFPSLFFSVCSGFVCLKPCILYAVRLFRLNKRGVWPKKAFGRTATGKLNMFFFSVQQLGCLENMKSIKLRGQWIPADLWISKIDTRT